MKKLFLTLALMIVSSISFADGGGTVGSNMTKATWKKVDKSIYLESIMYAMPGADYFGSYGYKPCEERSSFENDLRMNKILKTYFEPGELYINSAGSQPIFMFTKFSSPESVYRDYRQSDMVLITTSPDYKKITKLVLQTNATWTTSEYSNKGSIVNPDFKSTVHQEHQDYTATCTVKE